MNEVVEVAVQTVIQGLVVKIEVVVRDLGWRSRKKGLFSEVRYFQECLPFVATKRNRVMRLVGRSMVLGESPQFLRHVLGGRVAILDALGQRLQANPF